MKAIFIKNHDLGFWTQQPVSVKKIDGDEVIYCNHDGAVEEEQENVMYRPDSADVVWVSRVLICECGAYKLEGNDWWEDAPVEGAHE